MNTPLRLVITIALALLSFSCVTARDLERIEGGFATYQAKVDATLTNPALAPATKTAELEAANRELRDELKAVAAEVKQRTDAIVSDVKTTAAGSLGAGGAAGIAGIVTTLGGLALHVIRNRREEKLWGTPAEARTEALYTIPPGYAPPPGVILPNTTAPPAVRAG